MSEFAATFPIPRSQHYDKLAAAKPGSAAGEGGSGGEGKDGDGGKDIAALLAAEVAELKDKSNRRFKVCRVGKQETGRAACVVTRCSCW